MSARDSQIQLDKPPIVFVLAQIVISGLLNISKFIPDIQESLRAIGYPRTQKANIFELTMSAERGPSVSGSDKWIFSTKDNSAAVVINERFIVFEVGVYKGFVKFSEDLKNVLDIFKEVTGLELSERLGLRYINLVREASSTTFGDLLQPQLLGLNAESLGLTNATNFYQIRGSSPEGVVTVNLWQTRDSSFLPPDIDSTGISIDSKIEPGESVRILDIDHISNEDRDFTPELLIDALQPMHNRVETIFVSSVTPQALDYWEAVKPI